MKKQKGFTLIELLIVVMMIGLLSGVLLTVINTGAIRGSARDAQRASDLGKIQSALELYYAQNRQYPRSNDSDGWINLQSTDTLEDTLVSGGYINRFPVDPVNNDNGAHPGPCNDAESYRYNYISDGSFYNLTAIMEEAESAAPSRCADLIPEYCSGFPDNDTSTGSSCYVVQNP